MPNKDSIVRHHLLELMFYIDENGNKITINNSVERLKELGIYDDWKMCIEMTQSEHMRLHMTNLSDETKAKMFKERSGKNHPMYGKTHSNETKNKMSENSASPQLAKEFKKYRRNGGKLNWNDWRHEKSQKTEICRYRKGS